MLNAAEGVCVGVTRSFLFPNLYLSLQELLSCSLSLLTVYDSLKICAVPSNNVVPPSLYIGSCYFRRFNCCFLYIPSM